MFIINALLKMDYVVGQVEETKSISLSLNGPLNVLIHILG